MGIRVEHLTKMYGTQRAVDDISFEIETGEIVGFLGPNGAGKTTTMKILTCYMPPDGGTASLDEFNIHDHPLEIRKRIGYLPEHNPLYLDMYVHEFLRFTGRLYKLSAEQLRTRIPEIIEMTGLKREQHKKIGELSKGYRQRTGLAQALIHDPEVLILDEPTTGLDPIQIREIRSLIKEISKQKTIIFSTHILPEVEAIADRVIIINRGKIVLDKPMAELRSESEAEQAFRVEFEKPGFDFAALDAAGGVTKVTQAGDTAWVIHAEMDIRKTLFSESIRQDNLLKTFSREEQSLEEIFSNLTKTSA